VKLSYRHHPGDGNACCSHFFLKEFWIFSLLCVCVGSSEAQLCCIVLVTISVYLCQCSTNWNLETNLLNFNGFVKGQSWNIYWKPSFLAPNMGFLFQISLHLLGSVCDRKHKTTEPGCHQNGRANVEMVWILSGKYSMQIVGLRILSSKRLQWPIYRSLTLTSPIKP